MQTLLLALGLGLLVVLQAQDPLDVEAENQAPSGTLYMKAMASDKQISELKPDSVGPVTIVAQDGGSLEVTLNFVKKGQCHKLSTVLEKTEQPGIYLAFEGRTTVQVTQMKEKDHWVFQCQGEIHGQRFKHAKLIGKDPENNPAALVEFEQLAKERGLNLKSIFVPTQGESCSPVSD